MSLTKSAVASVADFAPKIANCPKGVRGRDTLLKSGQNLPQMPQEN